MEFARLEISAVRDVASKNEEAVVELNDLELTLIGGGTGDVQLG
jgi:hypothetical protein